MFLGKRNYNGLSDRQIEHCQLIWDFLCGERKRPLEVDEARHAPRGSRTRFVEDTGIVHLGADAYPGNGTSANSRMSLVACLAHELSHVERFERGYRRPIEMPGMLIDEAETSLNASFMQLISQRDREDLIEDARDRLIQWLAMANS